MRINRKGKVLCGCIIMGVLTSYAVAVRADTADSPAFADEKTMESNIKKSVDFYDTALQNFNNGNLPLAMKNIDQSLECDPGNQEAIDLRQKLTDRMAQEDVTDNSVAKPNAEPAQLPAHGLDQVTSTAPAVSISEQTDAEKTIQKNKAKAARYCEAARKDLKKENLSSAQKKIAQSLALDPQNKDALDLSKQITDQINQKNAAPPPPVVVKSVQPVVSAEQTEMQKTKEQAVKYFEDALNYFDKGNLSRAKKNIDMSLKYDSLNQPALDLSQKINDRIAQEAAALEEAKKNSASESAVSTSDSLRWLKRAQKAYMNRDISLALSYCDSSLKSDPSTVPAQQLQTRLQSLQARLNTVKSDMIESYLSRAEELIKGQNPVEAIWWINRTIAIVPEDKRALGLFNTAREAAKDVLASIKDSSARKKINRIVDYFIDDNFISADQVARELQKEYPLATSLTSIVENHLMEEVNRDKAQKQYELAFADIRAGRYENAFTDVKMSLFFDPDNFPARSLLEQVQFEMLNMTQTDAH
ncbi:MAG: hypothetical protein ABSH12_06750 [Endomicrobiales bacterium]